MKTPFFNGIGKLAKNETRFFVPGHKGNPNAIPAFAGVLPFDLTEVYGADDLSCPKGILMESQQNMAKAYQSGATLYSASGSTSCILAMITMLANASPNIVMARGCHVSAIRALAFTGLRPVWVLPISGRVLPTDIEHALRTSGAKSVYITSPTYTGQISDIKAIAKICKKYSAALLVDNAHGAYLKFVRPDIHPLTLGADAVADSAHKTLPCLTPAAMLHLKTAKNANAARSMLNMYSSTSPSYLALQSLDLAAGLLLENKINFAKTVKTVRDIRGEHTHLFDENCDEPMKLLFSPQKAGYTVKQLGDAFASAGILPEMQTDKNIVLMPSPYNTEEDFKILLKVLSAFPPRAPIEEEEPPTFILPQAACSVRQATFAEKEHVPVQSSLHRVAADTSAPCPPGVPILVPGERINENSRRFLMYSGITGIDVIK